MFKMPNIMRSKRTDDALFLYLYVGPVQDEHGEATKEDHKIMIYFSINEHDKNKRLEWFTPEDQEAIYTSCVNMAKYAATLYVEPGCHQVPDWEVRMISDPRLAYKCSMKSIALSKMHCILFDSPGTPVGIDVEFSKSMYRITIEKASDSGAQVNASEQS